MQLKVAPRVDARYWTAISVASMCGTNLGDVFPDIFGIKTEIAMIILVALFAALVICDRLSARGSEAIYWLSILVVRAGATQIADASIGKAHRGYLLVGIVLAILLTALVVARRRASAPRTSVDDLPATDGWYWLTMLTAGTLGTIMGDGLGHAFGPVSTGVPVSAVMATCALVFILAVRARSAFASSAGYWIAVVAVRWWGTNAGDILAFLASLMVSLGVTAAIMFLVLWLWRQPVSDAP